MVCWINKAFEGFRSVRSVTYSRSGWFSSHLSLLALSCLFCPGFVIFEARIKGFQGFRSVRSVTFYSGSGWFSTRCYHSLPLFFLLFFVLCCIFEGLGGFRVTVLSAGFVGKIFPQKFRKRFSRLSTIVAFASFSFVFYDVFSSALIAQICVDDCFATRLCSSGCRLLFCVSSTFGSLPKHVFRFFAPLPCGLQANVFAFPGTKTHRASWGQPVPTRPGKVLVWATWGRARSEHFCLVFLMRNCACMLKSSCRLLFGLPQKWVLFD